MGRLAAGKKARRAEGKKERGSKADKQDKRTFVPKYEYFAESKLASYPKEDGICVLDS